MSDFENNDLSEDKPSERFLDRLRKALRRDGDFPASARVVNELNRLVTDPKTTGNQIAELILQEPSLGTRILHLVNSSFYRRAKPIMTVSQAVVQIGMKPLAELCAGLVLLQRFVPSARKGGPFAGALRKLILNSLLARTITIETLPEKSPKAEETGFLGGCFAEMGSMLLAFYFPQIYETAAKRSQSKGQPMAQSIREITGHTPSEISIEVLNALGLPGAYQDLIIGSRQVLEGNGAQLNPAIAEAAQALAAASEISTVLTGGASKLELDRVITRLEQTTKLSGDSLSRVIGKLPALFRDHCSSIELDLPALPEYVVSYQTPTDLQPGDESAKQPIDRFMDYVNEVREAVEHGEPSSAVITTVMETCAWSLGFDRVLLMLVAPGRQKLVGRMLLGEVPNFSPTELTRPLGRETDIFAPDACAFHQARPVFKGDPIFKDGWPLAAIPVGFGSRAIGVIYADKTSSEEPEVSERLQAAIGVLAELLDRSVANSC